MTDAQVTSLIPTPQPGEPDTDLRNGVGCNWKVQDNLDMQNQGTLHVTVEKIPGSQSFAKLALKTEAKDANAPRIKGLGSFAYQASLIPADTEVKALVHGLLLDLEYGNLRPRHRRREGHAPGDRQGRCEEALTAVDRDDALDLLPPLYAVALRLHEVGAEPAVIAAGVGVEPESVGSLLSVAQTKLDEILRQFQS